MYEIGVKFEVEREGKKITLTKFLHSIFMFWSFNGVLWLGCRLKNPVFEGTKLRIATFVSKDFCCYPWQTHTQSKCTEEVKAEYFLVVLFSWKKKGLLGTSGRKRKLLKVFNWVRVCFRPFTHIFVHQCSACVFLDEIEFFWKLLYLATSLLIENRCR